MPSLLLRALLVGFSLSVTAVSSFAEEAGQVDNGTDPTKLSRSFSSGYEYLDLPGGGDVATLSFRYATPISADRRTDLQFKAPITDINVGSGTGLGLGDVSFKLSRVVAVKPGYGIVAAGELSFDTAAEPSGGNGTEVFKLTGIYAKFLKGGAIFAPAVVHTERVGARVGGRPDISNTVIDFYYVPKLADKRYFMTIDPSIKYDWVSDTASGAFAVTIGRILETGGRGTSSVFIKPTIGIGHHRGLDVGVEVGFKIVGF